MSDNRSQRLNYIDYLKTISMIAVIVIHVVAVVMKNVPINSNEALQSIGFDSVVRFSVPVFVMVSGALFLDPGKNITNKKIRAHILKLIIVFVIWSALYAIYELRDEIALTGLTKQNAIVFIKLLIDGHFHMWYIPMLIGMYILTPVLRLIARDRKTEGYFIILQILVCAIPVFIKGVTGKEFLDEFVAGFFVKINIFVAYYMAGDYFNRSEYVPGKKTKLLMLAGAVVSMAATAGFTVKYSISAGELTKAFFANSMPMQVISSICIFNLLKSMNCRPHFVAEIISKNTLGIYLVHVFVIYMIERLKIDGLLPPLIGIPLITICVLLISLGITLVLKRVPIIGRYIV